MSYTVGQIIYLLSKKDIKVFPALVVEEIKRKTIDQELVSYVIKLPDKDRSEVILEEIDAEIFVSLKDLEKSMIKNAKDQITALLNKAESVSEIFLDKKEVKKVAKENASESSLGDIAKVDLGNGQIANLINPIEDLDQKKNEESSIA